MSAIIIDTNALIYAVENKLDLLALLASKGYNIIIPNSVFAELQMLAKAAEKASDRKAAFIALKLLEQSAFTTAQTSGKTDDAILQLAKAEKAAVLTNDLALKKRLKIARVKVLHIRQKKYLEEWT